MDTRAFYDRISVAYDLLADASESACRDRGLSLLQAASGERVLELGFGTGHALAALAAAVGSDGRVCGCDVSAGMLAVARRRLEASGRPRVALALSDMRALCFPDRMFDTAFMSFTLELLEETDIAIALAEIRRVLRPGGRLGIVAMAEGTDTNAISEVYKWLHRHFPHFVDCRPIDVVALLEPAGLRVTVEQTMSVWGLPVTCAVAVNVESPS